MNILELMQAIENSDMEHDAKAEIFDILRGTDEYEDSISEYYIEVWPNKNPKDKALFPFEVVAIREGESTTLEKCTTSYEAQNTKRQYEQYSKRELCRLLQDEWR